MALPVLLLVIVSLLGVFVNYLRKVVAPKYPRD
jgi:hypothetical protein